MPIMKCGKGGEKYGESGKCYEGEGAHGKAVQQMRAIKAGTYKPRSDKCAAGVTKKDAAPRGFKIPRGTI